MERVNKAFVRDPEPGEPTCPEPKGCGGVGVPVYAETLRAQLSAEARRSFRGEAYYCPNPTCAVAYFDAGGNTATLDQVNRPAYPKPASAPLCNCLGVTADQIVEEAKRGDRDRIRQLVSEAENHARRCATRMPSGLPCATEARRLFMTYLRQP